MTKRKSGKTVVGVSIEGSTLHLVKLFRTKDATHLIAVRSYDLPEDQVYGSSVEEILTDIEEQPLDDSGSIDITREPTEDELELQVLEESSTIGEEDAFEEPDAFHEVFRIARGRSCRLAVTVAEPKIYYSIFDSDWGLSGDKLMKMVKSELAQLKDEYHSLDKHAIGLVKLTDGRLLAVVRERSIPLFDYMQYNREIRNSKLPRVKFTESLELSLVNLVIERTYVKDDAITLILYVGADFSRFIFLRGREIHHISELIADGANTPHVASTLYSRLLFEMDTLDLPKLDSIFFAGLPFWAGVPEFFKENFAPDIAMERITFDDLEIIPEETEAQIDLAQYLVAIGSALRGFEPKREGLVQVDLTPPQIRERQNTLKLSAAGWLLLFMVPLLAALTLYRLSGLDSRMRDLRRETIQKQAQVDYYADLDSAIAAVNATLAGYERSFFVIDSLAVGTETYSTLLEHIFDASSNLGGLWFTEIVSEDDNKLAVRGYALYRNRISQFVDALGTAELNQVDAQEIREKTVFRFDVSVQVTK